MQVGACFEKAWATFARNPWPFVIGTIVLVVTNAVFGFLNRYVLGISVVGSIINGLFYGGLIVMGLRATRGEAYDVPDVFVPFARPVPYIVVNLAILAGVLLCGVGLLVTSFLFMFATIFVAEGDDFGTALGKSKDVVLANVAEALVLFLVVLVTIFAGVLACGLGVLVTIPLGILLAIEGLRQIQANPAHHAV